MEVFVTVTVFWISSVLRQLANSLCRLWKMVDYMHTA